ncbi:MAG TPA: uroporphyrinogen decarboxylase family protein [Bacteroidales bacterium]|nr:uroporphyrinogen decarboxylase family protein [Bacteroidales bacterium]
MNGLERVKAAVTGADADCQPYTMLYSLYGASLIQSDTHTYYHSAERWFEGQMAVDRLFDPDIIITPFSFPIEAEAFGSELIYLNQYAPNVRKPIITDLSQIDSLPEPDFETSPSVQFFLQGIDLVSREFKGKRAIAAPIHSPCDLPALLLGIERWIDTLFFHPDAVDRILKKTVDHFIRFGNEYFARGATFLVIPVDFTTPMIITEHLFKRLLPYLNYAFSQLNGPVVIHNGGSKLLPFLHHFTKLPNVIAFVLEPTESFAEARRIIGPDKVLMGNFDGPDFVNLSKDKACEIALKILNDRKEDKHFIFASSNADIPYLTSDKTILSVVDTIRQFKKY